jgi:hypothetical protein
MTATPAPSRHPGPIAWLLVVVAIGVVMGAVLVVAAPGPAPPPGPHAGPAPPVPHAAPVFISGLDLVFLLALILVYVRTYADTRARFALGLVVFLLALFFETLVSSPVVLGVLGYAPGNLGFFFLLAGILEALALVVFLFLSLE